MIYKNDESVNIYLIFIFQLNIKHEHICLTFLSKAILGPSAYDTGNYSCIVQTFQSFDEKTSPLIIIDPKTSMNITLQTDHENDFVYIECTVLNIYKIYDIHIS